MNQGFYLSIRMGSVNPTAVPQQVIEALTEVSVSSTVGPRVDFK